MSAPLVSVIIIFHDEERFLGEAIESVLSQTDERWELILVDDGSTDASPVVARAAVERRPHRIRVVTHPDRENRGMSASRNLGLTQATGQFVAFLDGDDVWLPDKLARQLARLLDEPAAAMVFGPLLRWLRWTGDPDAADHENLMGVGWKRFGSHPLAGRVVDPPELAELMLTDDYFIPSGALIRREAVEAVGGFEDRFRTLYEDAVFMMKLCLRFPVLVTDDVTYLYRIHVDSSTQRAGSDTEIDEARTRYLDWVGEHLDASGLRSRSLDRKLARARRSTRRGRLRRRRLLDVGRALGRSVLPRPVRDRLRRWWRGRTRPRVPGS